MSERKYLLDVDISVCFEANETCEIIVPVLKATKLSKSTCRWDSDFNVPCKLKNIDIFTTT